MNAAAPQATELQAANQQKPLQRKRRNECLTELPGQEYQKSQCVAKVLHFVTTFEIILHGMFFISTIDNNYWLNVMHFV